MNDVIAKNQSVRGAAETKQAESASAAAFGKTTWLGSAPRWGYRDLVLFTLVFAASCFVFFSDLGAQPLFNPDEALYSEPAREMIETGEYVTTLLNYVVRYTKPPLTIWAQALGYQIFGVNEFAARFFTAVCASLLVAATYAFCQRYAGRRAAIFAALSLMTAPLFIGTGREAITDMPLSFFIAGSLMSFYHAFARASRGWSWVGYVLIGLAIMTKGPVGLLLPVAILFCYHLLRGQLKQAYTAYKPISGLLLVACIALPWFATEIWVTKGEYYREFIVRENFQRFTSVVDHKAPWWYHIAAMFGGFFPMSIFLPQAWIRAFLSGTTSARSVLSGWLSRYRNISNEQALALFTACWSLITLIFFSASVSKLLPYTVPAFPALAILVGMQLRQFVDRSELRKIALYFAVLFAVYGLAFILLPLGASKLKDCPQGLMQLIPLALTIQTAAAAVTVVASWKGKPQPAMYAFCLVTFFSMLFFGSQAQTILSNEWEVPVRDFSRFAAVSDRPIIVLGMRKPSVPFYAHRHVIVPSDKPELETRLVRLKDAYIIGRTRDAQYLSQIEGAKTVATVGKFVLISWIKPKG